MEYADNGDIEQKVNEHIKNKTQFSNQEMVSISC